MDMATVLPHAFGIEDQMFTGDPVKLAAATNLFVGITRPRHFLGLAMRKSAASAELLSAAAAQQWRVIDLTTLGN
jgi:DNA helicase-2/ATP-dependent DNA helicase PcrA